METELIPYTAQTLLPARRVLVLAPHADDEVFGCCGAIASHLAANVPVTVIILSDVEVADDAKVRANESIQAAQMLGYGMPEFWHLPDRGLHCSETLITRLASRIRELCADLIYVPSPWEIHPDHRQTMMLAIEAAKRIDSPLRLAFYEVGSPLRPNVLLDITAYLPVKQAAMQCFTSQLALQDYFGHISALNRYRTYTLARGIAAAEAFWLVSASELNCVESADFFRMVSPGLAVSPNNPVENLPLVSVIVRSMDRSSLAESIDSIALQTYRNVEVLVVAACEGHRQLPEKCGTFPIRLLTTGAPLARSKTANKGLDAACGKYCLFLDDDDWLMPAHIARLAAVLEEQPNAFAVYTGISLVDAKGQPLGQTFDLPFDAVRQMAGNLCPIHAVLFHHTAVEKGCRFDEALDRYEDWDFWLQLARLAPMVHLPGVSGAYRIHESSGVHVDGGPTGQTTSLIYKKWEPLWTREQIGQVMQRVWSYPEISKQLDVSQRSLDRSVQSLDHLQTALRSQANTIADQHTAIDKQQATIDKQQATIDKQQATIDKQQATIDKQQATIDKQHATIDSQNRILAQQQFHIDHLTHRLERAEGSLHWHQATRTELLASTSWRITKPLRLLSALVRRLIRLMHFR